MTDRLTPAQRSYAMSRVGPRDTEPELVVRRALHAMGYRFRLHRADLPGKPDIVLPRHKKVVFVHGCFWHGHRGCPRAVRPATNTEFWDRKLDANMARDAANLRDLRKSGWKVLVVWGCEVASPTKLARRLARFMSL